VVDTQSIDRVGPAGPWLQAAEHVVVVDHHLGVVGDIDPDEVIVEPVGSATTVLVERLHALSGEPERLTLTETEATLFALGIRADTGALSFPATTPRDAYALAWLMEQGCSQSAIAEFGQARLSAHQRDLLSTAMDNMHFERHEGLKLGSVVLDTGRGFVTGMASVCEELLQLLGSDVVVLGVLHRNAKNQTFLSLIGRASSRAEGRRVDLNAVMATWQGGGHPAAAAASIKLEVKAVVALAAEDAAETGEEAEQAEADASVEMAEGVVTEVVAAVHAQIPEQVRAADLMTKTIASCKPTDSMDHVLGLMNRVRHRSLPVVADDGELLGFLKYRDPVKAAQSGKGQQQAKAWMRKELLTVGLEMPFNELEALLLEGSTGRLHVVDDDNHLLGLVSRTDMLRQYNLYAKIGRRVV